MRKIFMLLALVPSLALATCTWTQDAGQITGTVVCTTANESAPTLATQGWQVNMCPKGVTLFICADSGQTLSGSGTVKVYLYNPAAALWGETPDLALSPTVASARCQGFSGIWSVVNSGRLAAVPVSVGVSSGGFTAYFSCN